MRVVLRDICKYCASVFSGNGGAWSLGTMDLVRRRYRFFVQGGNCLVSLWRDSRFVGGYVYRESGDSKYLG